MNKTYRCLDCGFVLTVDANDNRSFEEINHQIHRDELYGVEDKSVCPSCSHKMRKSGGKANPLKEETAAIRAQVKEIEADFQDLVNNRAKGRLTAVRAKYGTKKLWGKTIDELLALNDQLNT